MSADDLRIKVRIEGEDDASAPAEKAAGALSKIGVAAAAAGVAVAAAAAAAAAAAYQIGAEFDDAYDTIRTSTGATGEALAALQDDFRAVAGKVPADFGTVSTAIAELSKRTGQSGEDLQGLSAQMIRFSQITGGDLKNQIGLATRTFGDWSIATEDQAGALDKVYRASQATGAGVDVLMGRVVQFGAPLRAMNFSFDESLAMLGKWEKEGVNTELVLGSLRIAMGKFADQNVPMREGLESTFETIQKLGPGAEATSLAMDVFGARAGPDMAAAILEGRFALGDLLKTVSEGSDTVTGAAEDTADFAETWQVFTNRAKLAIEPLAGAVFDAANVILQRMLPALDSFLVQLGPVAAFIGAELVPAIESIFDWIGQTSTQWGESTSGMATGWQEFWTILQPLFVVLFEHFQKIYAEVLPELQATWSAVVGGITTFWVEHWDTIKTVMEVAVAILSTNIGAAFDIIRGIWIASLRLLRGDWQGAWDAITEAFGSAWDRVRTLLESGVDVLKGHFRQMGPALLGLLRDGLNAAWGGVIDNVREGVGRIASLLPHSLAEEGPLSVAVNWDDVLTGNLEEAQADVLASHYLFTEGVVTMFSGMTRGVQAERVAVEEELSGMTDFFMKAAQQAAARAAEIRTSADVAVEHASRISVANAGAVPQRRDYLTPDEAMNGEKAGPALDSWGRDMAGNIVDWGRYNFKQNEEAAHRAHSFDVGGWVPGPVGAPLKATLHGGEYVTRAGESVVDYGKLAAAIADALGSSPLIIRIPGIEDAVVYAQTRNAARGRG